MKKIIYILLRVLKRFTSCVKVNGRKKNGLQASIIEVNTSGVQNQLPFGDKSKWPEKKWITKTKSIPHFSLTNNNKLKETQWKTTWEC